MADGASILKAYFTARKRLSANLRSLEKRAYFVRSKDGTLISPKTLLPEIPKNVLKYREKLKAGKELTKRQIEEIKASTRRLETLNKQRYEKTVGAGGVTARRQRQIEREQATFKASVTKARKYREKEARESQRIREEIEAEIRAKEAAEKQREYEDEMYEDEGEAEYEPETYYTEPEGTGWNAEYFDELQNKFIEQNRPDVQADLDNIEALAREADAIVVNFLAQCEPWLEALEGWVFDRKWKVNKMTEMITLLKQVRADIDAGRFTQDTNDLISLLQTLEENSDFLQTTIDLIKKASTASEREEVETNLTSLAEIFMNRALTLEENSSLNEYLERMWGYSA